MCEGVWSGCIDRVYCQGVDKGCVRVCGPGVLTGCRPVIESVAARWVVLFVCVEVSVRLFENFTVWYYDTTCR